jgi:hypothetical protein
LRIELKYLLSSSRVYTLRRQLSPFLRRDPHTQSEEDPSYKVTTLYHTSPQEKGYRLRSRFYQGDPASLFLEVKYRQDSGPAKERTPFPCPEPPLNETLASLWKRPPDPHPFFFYLLRDRSRPRLWTTFTREAWTWIGYPRLRITLDRDLRSSPFRRGIEPLPDRWLSLYPRRDRVAPSILEIKCQGTQIFLPPPLMRLLADERLIPQAISKYTLAESRPPLYPG